MTIKKSVLWIVVGMIAVFSFGPAGAQPQPEAPLVESVDMTVTARKMPPDERGTNVENIYNFRVHYTDGIARESAYNVLVYLDGVYAVEYKGVTLPYQFSRDFKGQLDGSHEVRVDLEDANLTIVGRKTVVVNVAHHKEAGGHLAK